MAAMEKEEAEAEQLIRKMEESYDLVDRSINRNEQKKNALNQRLEANKAKIA